MTDGTVVASANDVDETDDGYPSLEAFGDGGPAHMGDVRPAARTRAEDR